MVIQGVAGPDLDMLYCGQLVEGFGGGFNDLSRRSNYLRRTTGLGVGILFCASRKYKHTMYVCASELDVGSLRVGVGALRGQIGHLWETPPMVVDPRPLLEGFLVYLTGMGRSQSRGGGSVWSDWPSGFGDGDPPSIFNGLYMRSLRPWDRDAISRNSES